MTTTDAPNPRDIAPICKAIAAPVVAARGPAPIRARGGVARLLKTESGRTVTHGEVVAGLLARASVEAEVIDGVRPEFVKCEACAKPIKVKPTGGALPRKCDRCVGRVCMSCGKKKRKSKTNVPEMCLDCSVKAGKRRAGAAKRHASMTPEERSRIAKKGAASMTEEAKRASTLRRSKLSEEQARAVIARFASGEEQPSIAASLGVTQACVSAIVTGKNWKHLQP